LRASRSPRRPAPHLEKERAIPRGDKGRFTGKQKRRVEHIEKGYEKRGPTAPPPRKKRPGPRMPALAIESYGPEISRSKDDRFLAAEFSGN